MRMPIGFVKVVLGLLGVFMLLVVAMTLNDGIEDYGRLKRINTEGKTVTATVIKVEEESVRGPARDGTSTNDPSPPNYMASVRYEVAGQLITPEQRLGIGRASAERFRAHQLVTLEIIVLPDSLSHPYLRDDLTGNRLAAFMVPILALGVGLLCFFVAFAIRKSARGSGSAP